MRDTISPPRLIGVSSRLHNHRIRTKPMPLNVNTNRNQVIAAHQRVCLQGEPNTFALFATTGNVLSVSKLGAGLAAMKPLLVDNQVIFGSFRVTAIDQRQPLTSRRAKQVALTWVGPRLSALRKAHVSAEKTAVLGLLLGIGVTIDASTTEDLSMGVIADKLLRVGGAHRPTHYEFGPDEIWAL